MFDKWKIILEDHGLRVSESRTEIAKHNGEQDDYLGLATCDEDVNHGISVGSPKW